MRAANTVVFAVMLLSATCGLSKEKPKPPSQAELDEITARGKALYDYDQAARFGTAALWALNPKTETVQATVAMKTDRGWVVDFGHLNVAADRFVIAYEATATPDPKKFEAKALDPPREDSGFVLAAARALSVSGSDFGRPSRPYNAAVLPASDKNLFVYVYPAQTQPNIFPLGGDVRYLITPDGSKIIEKRQMHKSILESDSRQIPPGTKLAGGFHNHVLSDVPEDTDVFCVLARTPLRPEYVGASGLAYEVKTDGNIRITKK